MEKYQPLNPNRELHTRNKGTFIPAAHASFGSPELWPLLIAGEI